MKMFNEIKKRRNLRKLAKALRKCDIDVSLCESDGLIYLMFGAMEACHGADLTISIGAASYSNYETEVIAEPDNLSELIIDEL